MPDLKSIWLGQGMSAGCTANAVLTPQTTKTASKTINFLERNAAFMISFQDLAVLIFFERNPRPSRKPSDLQNDHTAKIQSIKWKLKYESAKDFAEQVNVS